MPDSPENLLFGNEAERDRDISAINKGFPRHTGVLAGREYQT